MCVVPITPGPVLVALFVAGDADQELTVVVHEADEDPQHITPVAGDAVNSDLTHVREMSARLNAMPHDWQNRTPTVLFEVRDAIIDGRGQFGPAGLLAIARTEVTNAPAYQKYSPNTAYLSIGILIRGPFRATCYLKLHQVLAPLLFLFTVSAYIRHASPP